MKKGVVNQQINAIMAVVAKSETGKLFSELYVELKTLMSRRTLQRRLEELVSEKNLSILAQVEALNIKLSLY